MLLNGLNLLFTNATVADDAIRFVAEHDRSSKKSNHYCVNNKTNRSIDNMMCFIRYFLYTNNYYFYHTLGQT
jgi:hypothetical protein